MSIRDHLLERYEQELIDLEHRTFDGIVKYIPHLKHDHAAVRDVNKEFRDSFSPLDRVAVFVTDRVGTFGFFLIILTWTVVWLGWNTIGPTDMRYDPAPAFVLWLFVSNMIQIMLMPLIMVGQNLQGRHSELRAESDFEINRKAEKEIQAILLHLEHQAAEIERQGELIVEILQNLNRGGDAAKRASSGSEGNA